MKQLPSLAGLTLLLCGTSAMAEQVQAVNYDYVEVGYKRHGDQSDFSTGGMQLTVSKRVDEFYFELNAEQFERNVNQVNTVEGFDTFHTNHGVELTRYRVGGGFIFDLDSASSVDVGLLHGKMEIDYQIEYLAVRDDGVGSIKHHSSGSLDTDLWDLRVQYQNVFSNNLALKAAIGYEYLSGYAPNNLYGLVAVGYHFNKAWSVNTEYRYADEFRNWGVNLQYAF
ncbi:hypothetical protein [Pseudoalteromonas rubra]|uniref:Outer membrane protein beta-barrel domain-containing protein n=1 Tax=Pseudoalteromonas rubra TaxID=43658 RepID=A0A0U2XDG9_9GAMM|nr:hypothetical protein [Pseudoalteromonas rubra]ALU45908.1 hypothetical protein AT705_23575 [Pseudoalteromonas rubra]